MPASEGSGKSMCRQCKYKNIHEDYAIHTDIGSAYFCSNICKLTFACKYDFEQEIEECLIKFAKDYHIYHDTEIIRLVLLHIKELMTEGKNKDDTGLKIIMNSFGKELSDIRALMGGH